MFSITLYLLVDYILVPVISLCDFHINTIGCMLFPEVDWRTEWPG